ncbi:FHA domain-containing protein [Haliangium sp.]|uniref:FHA domain-containing protein n=1 Tax=Haliangium sp. TaxID=2663208 RepID=UPI003D123066
MIICYRCGKENQDHYKFCLGCGAELTGPPKGEPAPPPPSPPPPSPPPPADMAMMNTVMADERHSASHGAAGNPSASYGAQPMDGGGWSGQPYGGGGGGGGGGMPPSAPRPCPTCGSAVPPEFRFCGACGHKMDGVQAPQAPPPEMSPAAAHWAMVLIRPDGTEGGLHELHGGENQLGRDHGEIFENDGYLSPTHAALIVEGGATVIRDLGSLNGVFVKMNEDEELRPGQVIRIGQELLRFDTIEPPQPLEDGTEVMGSPNPGYWGKITVVIGNGVDGSAYPLLNEAITLGRERGDINFPEDGYVSGLHARLSNQNGRYVLSDLGSSNGTFIRVHGERAVGDGSFILLGQQLFRLSIQG